MPFGMWNARKSTSKSSEASDIEHNDTGDEWTHVEHVHLSLENVLQGLYQYRPAGQLAPAAKPVKEKIDEGTHRFASSFASVFVLIMLYCS